MPATKALPIEAAKVMAKIALLFIAWHSISGGRRPANVVGKVDRRATQCALDSIGRGVLRPSSTVVSRYMTRST